MGVFGKTLLVLRGSVTVWVRDCWGRCSPGRVVGGAAVPRGGGVVARCGGINVPCTEAELSAVRRPVGTKYFTLVPALLRDRLGLKAFLVISVNASGVLKVTVMFGSLGNSGIRGGRLGR